MKKKKVYIIGIVGTIGTGLARAFKKAGWKVSGSDQENVFPPLTTALARAKIPFYRGYAAHHVPRDADLVLVGGSALVIDRHNPEYLQAQKYHLPILNHAEAIARFVVKKNSLVVAGSYGKTTITSLLVTILKEAHYRPAYMIGGWPLNRWPSLAFSESNWSIVEGDEYWINPEKPQAKFFLYHPHYLLLTAAHWEHPDVYSRPELYYQAFQKLVRLVPSNGLVVANYFGEHLDFLRHRQQVVWYSSQKGKGDCFLAAWQPRSQRMQITVNCQGTKVLFQSPLLGKHNAENIVAAVTMAHHLGISWPVVRKAISKAKGVKRRLEYQGTIGGITIFEDFSQTPPRIKAALQALRDHFPQRRILVVFYPHYSGWRDKSILRGIKGLFGLANKVWLTRVHFDRRPAAERVTGPLIAKALGGANIEYCPDDRILEKKVKQELRPGDVLVFMSSGGLRGLKERVINFLEHR